MNSQKHVEISKTNEEGRNSTNEKKLGEDTAGESSKPNITIDKESNQCREETLKTSEIKEKTKLNWKSSKT